MPDQEFLNSVREISFSINYLIEGGTPHQKNPQKKPWLQHYPPDVSKGLSRKSRGFWAQMPLILIPFPDVVLFAFLWKSVVDAESVVDCLTAAPPNVPPSHLAVPAAVKYSLLPPTASLVANYPPEVLPEPATPFPENSRDSTSSGERVWARQS